MKNDSNNIEIFFFIFVGLFRSFDKVSKVHFSFSRQQWGVSINYLQSAL